MNEYLFEYKTYVGHRTVRYQVVAENEHEAEDMVVNALAGKTDMIPCTLKLIRKLNPSFGEES